MFFFVGGAMGYISTISTKIEQVRNPDEINSSNFKTLLRHLAHCAIRTTSIARSCPRWRLIQTDLYTDNPSFQILCAQGYSDQLSGLSGSLVLLCGTLASFPMGLLSYKTGQPIMICKINSLFVIGSMISLGYFMCVPDQGLAIAFR